MSKTPSKSTDNSTSGLQATQSFEFQRIRVNRQGYDATGAYWGDGPDVFIATSRNGIEEMTVRARTVTDARAKVRELLEREPGAKVAKHQELGGASEHTSRYEIDWRDPVNGTDVRLRITHARNYLGMDQDHVEIESIRPKRAPLPVTETGYKSHFIDALDLINAGGPITLVRSWLDAEARGKAWQQKQAAAKAQGDLFQWADAKREVGKRKAKPRRDDSTPSRRAKPARDPA
jgi:hypothetical protein